MPLLAHRQHVELPPVLVDAAGLDSKQVDHAVGLRVLVLACRLGLGGRVRLLRLLLGLVRLKGQGALVVVDILQPERVSLCPLGLGVGNRGARLQLEDLLAQLLHLREARAKRRVLLGQDLRQLRLSRRAQLLGVLESGVQLLLRFLAVGLPHPGLLGRSAQIHAARTRAKLRLGSLGCLL